MTEQMKSEMISRRKMLFLFGLAGAAGVAVPSALLTVSDAEALTQIAQAPPPQSPLSPQPTPPRPLGGQTQVQTGTERRQARRTRRVKRRAARRQARQQGRAERRKSRDD
jgi:hypothetical protein